MPRSLRGPDLDERDRKAISDVEEHGLHIIYVFPEGGTPGWAYSFGLWHNYHHPELAVFGLDHTVSHGILNHAADEIRAGRPFEARKQYPDLLEGVDCAFHPVAPIWHHPFFGWADWFYQDAQYPFLQCIWPDREQRWPWEEGFRPEWLWAQPLLWHKDPADARAEKLLESMGLDSNPDAGV